MPRALWVLGLVFCLFVSASAVAQRRAAQDDGADPYAELVWPPPPDEGKIRLTDVIRGRVDVEVRSRLWKNLVGVGPAEPFDRLRKPFAVDFTADGRILVTDSALGALFRFDRAGRRVDVFGTKGVVRLRTPLGLAVGPEGTVYVADVGIDRVLAFDAAGKVVNTYGGAGELENPTDAAVSPDGSRLLVADSKAHRVVIFDRASGEMKGSFGGRGQGEGEFAFPTSLAFDGEGRLFVVDQINARVQVLTEDGEFLDQFGNLGVGFGDFVRPKDVAVDAHGLIYVTDNAFNNFQLFDADLTLLTWVGDGGMGPGQFHGASGIAVRGDEIAVVDQLEPRLQVFRFLQERPAP